VACTASQANTTNVNKPSVKRKRPKMRIGTWNVRTMYAAGKLAEICREMDKVKLEILGLCETRWNQSGEHQTADGKLLLYSGMPEEDDDHVRGVGVLISRKLKDHLVEWLPVSERLMKARFKTKHRHFTIVQGYAPTEDATLEDKEAFYSSLDGLLTTVPKRDVVFLLGDYNARVGADNEGLEHVMGPHGIGRLNENGALFLELCGNHALKVGGTMFLHKTCHKHTWFSNDHRTKAQLDHVCISRSWSKSLLDVRSFRGADVGSDHHLVVASVRMQFVRTPKTKATRRRTFNTNQLQNQDTKTQFVECLREKLLASNGQETVESRWTSVKTAFTATAQEVLGFADKRKKEWLSEETWKIVEERRQAKLRMCENTDQAKAQDLDNNYNNLNKAVKRSARRDKRKYLEDLAGAAQEAATKGHTSQVYQIIDKLSQNQQKNAKAVKDKNGTILVAIEDQLKRWAEYFQENLSHVQDSSEVLQPRITPELKIDTNPPTKPEIIKALKELKNRKAAGIDEIPAEILKADVDTTAEALLPLFRDVWINESLPEDWLQGIIIKIPKKGDLSECKNWRGINLLSIVSKVFTKIILNRLLKVVEPLIRKQQSGFRPEKSCVDLINTLRIIIEQSVEWRSPLYLLFVDYQVAFDSLDRDCIWIALKNRGVPDKIIRVIQKLYSGFRCRVLHDGKYSEPFSTASGVRQGCMLSPLIFLVVLDEVTRAALDNKNRGIQWNLVEKLEDLDFADDVVLMSHRLKDMQDKANDLVKEAAKVGLKINIAKTKELRINNNTTEPIYVNGEEIERVADFTYLGANVSTDGGCQKDVEQRISKARCSFARLKNVWRAKNMDLKLKLKIFDACVKSVLLYGCETWFVTNTIESKLQTFVNRCLRNILGIWWPNTISNQDLWKKTNQKCINLEIKKRKYGWIGHTLRKDGNEVCHQALEWNPQGTRRPGRPKATWRRTVLQECDKKSFGEMRSLARNRVRWRSYTNSLCS
jgi:Reverse transcriptase (RNA-dependent DNA polymerase)/Domain of unknown function (DUF6451)